MIIIFADYDQLFRGKKLAIVLKTNVAIVFFSVSDPLCLSSSLALHFFPIILFWSTTLLTGMTGISLHLQWPLTSQSHGSLSQRQQLFFLLWIKINAIIRLGVSPPS
jgi:hypothetical protein